MKIILWADDPDFALPVRAALRQEGHSAMIRDARAFFGFGDVEAADAIGFISAGKEALILAEYRGQVYAERHGQVRVLDIKTGLFGEAVELPDLNIDKPAPEPSEKDLLSARIDNLGDDDLRAYARGVTGAEIPEDASREEIEALIRTGTFPARAAPAAPPPPAAPPEGAGEAGGAEPPSTGAGTDAPAGPAGDKPGKAAPKKK